LADTLIPGTVPWAGAKLAAGSRPNRQAGCLPYGDAHFKSIGGETGNGVGCDGERECFIGKFADFKDLDGNEFLNEEISEDPPVRG
jgi:hypothetical protein